jgi:hypothetical protein
MKQDNVKDTVVNKKVRNATKVTYNDIQFDSKLELYTYQALGQAAVESLYNNISYTIIPGFEYAGRKLRPITYTPDFVGNGWVIEVKGFASKDFPLR